MSEAIHSSRSISCRDIRNRRALRKKRPKSAGSGVVEVVRHVSSTLSPCVPSNGAVRGGDAVVIGCLSGDNVEDMYTRGQYIAMTSRDGGWEW